MFFSAATGRSESTYAMRIINHEQNIFRAMIIVAPGQFEDFTEWRVIASHAENTIGHNDDPPAIHRRFR